MHGCIIGSLIKIGRGDDIDQADLNRTDLYAGAGLGKAYLPTLTNSLPSNQCSSCLRKEIVAYIEHHGLRPRFEQCEDLELV
jgi:hypothetical protein